MVVEPTWKHEFASQHFGTSDPVENRNTCILSHFKLNRPLCFTLYDGNVPEQFRDIKTLERDGLIVEWQRCFDREPPPRLATVMMRKILAYELQCRTAGGLYGTDRRALAAIASGRGVSDAVPRSTANGTGLVREWNGRLYRVQVVDGGYEMDGVSYRSLSAVAKTITGTAWSGPRFFGLTAKRAG